ncbi:MAG TPA: cyclic nucleotide-binding domain-containing protein [Caldimonas sp.]|nr:cyclic nucleotide-binding domain-containing protein [Caldimonas sp.]
MTTQEIAAQVSAYVSSALSSPTELLAIFAATVAGGLQISSSFVKTMVPLRWLAVLSNVGFLGYGVLHPSFVMALMHGVLLPINCIRLREMTRLTRRVHAATNDTDRSGIWLRPYMKSSRRKAGEVLFRLGDPAEHLYILIEGRIDFLEINASLGPGQMFGEIAFFSPERRRTATARCGEDCVLLSIDQSTVRQLYFQNPGFGFEIVGLVAGRLSADIARLRSQLVDQPPLA